MLSDNRQFYIKEFDNNYYYNFKTDFRFFKFVEIYVRTRIFDMKSFKDDMEVIINTIDTDKLPGHKRLLTEEYWKIPDDKFNAIIDEILNDVKNGNLQLVDIVKLFMYFNYFARRGLIDYDMKTLKSVFFNGMNISSLNSGYCDNVEEELMKVPVGEANADIEEILVHFNDINIKLKDKMYQQKAEEIFKCIPMKMELFYDRFEKECMDVPILKYYDAFQIFQRLSCASNEDIITIKEILMRRYQKFGKELEGEVKNLTKLKQIIDDYIDGKEPTIKTVMLQEFARDLTDILNKYKLVLPAGKR